MTDHPLPILARNSQSSVKKTRYNIADIRCISSPRPGSICRALSSRLYVEASVDGLTKRTSLSHVSNDGAWNWNESVDFDVEGASILKLCLYRQHYTRRHRYIGESEFITSELSGHDAISRKLRKHSRGTVKDTVYTISFTVECVDAFECVYASASTNHTHATQSNNDTIDHSGRPDLQTVDELIEATGEALKKTRQGPSVPTKVSDIVDLGKTVADSSAAQNIESLLEKLTILMPLVDEIAKIHPYVQVACSVLSVIPKTILAQVDRDKKIADLVENMNDTFSFVRDADSLQKISKENSSLHQILSKMIQQITECTYFICTYSEDLGFGKRMMKNMLSNTDKKIEEFRKTFEQLTMNFQSAVTVESAIQIVHLKMLTESIGEKVDYVAESVDLRDMPYATGAGHQVERCCLPHTRQKILDEIVDWVNTPNCDSTERVLWLSGLAGMGKSTIAHTIAEIFNVHQRLGTFFAFSLANQTDRRLDNLFSTIAINLCSLDPEWKHSLWKVVKDKPALRTTPSIHMQFTEFLLGPIKESDLSLVGPIVIIIDALDEAGNAESRQGILSILEKSVIALPSNFRIIITSRPEDDIRSALDGKPHIKRIQMENFNISDTTNDLNLFVASQLTSLTVTASLERQWPNKQWCPLLVTKSEGLFQWAATACRIINGNGKRAGTTPAERFESILGVASNLDSLYLDILQRTFDVADTTAMERFRGVMGVLLQSKVPLSISSLSELCSQEYTPDILDSVLTPLSSLLSGVDRQSDPIRFLHTSFRDLLEKVTLLNKDKDSVENNLFYVDSSVASRNFAVRCLRFMKELRFNICEVKTSHVRNVDDPALPARIKQYIFPQLSYSCRFWAAHLKAARCDADIIHMVHETLYIRFLYWLEVLSSISAITGVSESLFLVEAWGRNAVSDDLSEATEKLRKEILDFIEDALQFIGVFGTPISQSAPHIYLSALPSAPTRSIVFQTFLPQFKNVFIYETGERQYWPACQNTFRVPADIHSPGVNVIGFPDAKRFISTFSDSVIRKTKCFIWDVETCSILNELEHSSDIESVAVSQDSEYLISASSDAICVWNLGSRAVEVRIELAPDEAAETRVVTISPDGTCLALAKCYGRSGSKIFVWNARTGRVIAGPFITNGFIAFLAFSSDNSKLYSVTWRVPLCVTVWDVESGSSEVHQLEGDPNPDRKYDPVLAFSPDRRRLAFYSYNHDQIDIYDIEEHNFSFSFNVKTRSGPFGDFDDDRVCCLAFSQNGRRIVSGGFARFCVWDACTGDMIAGPFEGDGLVSSLAFLGEHRIISAGKEGTIQIWNTVNVVHPEPYGEVIKNISSLDFSPSGEHIVSTAGEKTIGLWNAKTGRACRTHLDIEESNIEFNITFAAFTPDGNHIVTASRGDQNPRSIIRIWNTADNSMGPVSIIIEQKYSWYSEPKISPDSKSVSAVLSSQLNYGDTIGLWDTTTGSPQQASPKYPFTSELEDKYIQFWDGKLVAYTGNANDLYIYDTEKGTVTTKECVGPVSRPVTLSQNHRYVAGYARHNSSHNIMIWDMETGNDSGLLQIENWIDCLIFSPNSRFLVSASDDTLLVWDVKCNLAAKPLALRGHRALVRSVAFSKDSRYIVSSGDDNMIRIWDVSDLGNDNGERPIAEGLPEFGDDDDLVDGWVRGPEGELLFWVPSWNRVGLARPRNTVVIGKGANKLNFTRFVHGEDWWKCYTGASE